MAELTTSGFERRNRTQILEDVRSRFKTKFGQNINLEEDSVMGKLAALAAELELEYEKLAEEQHFSQTLGGAEGLYLDDLLSKYGVFREGKVAGRGVAHILYTIPSTPNGDSDDTITVQTSAMIDAENGRTYSPVEDTVLFTNTSGLIIHRSDLVSGYTYLLEITDTDGNTKTDSWTYNGSFSSATQVLDGIANFIADNTVPEDKIASGVDDLGGNGNIYVLSDQEAGTATLYVGYKGADEEEDFIGLTTPVYLGFSKAAGKRWSAVEVECNTKGYYPVPRRTVSGMSPEPNGFETITNPVKFDAGSNTETDAEYKNRYFDVISSGSSGTKDGIITALRNIEGVDNVRVYDNATTNWYVQKDDGTFEFTDSVSNSDTKVAEPLTFNPVVKGGLESDIADTLYNNKPINVKTSEQAAEAKLAKSVVTADGTTEDIYYTPASNKNLDIKVEYTSGDGIPLSGSETNTMKENIQSIFDRFEIGDIVFNTQVVAAILSSLTFDRVRNIAVTIDSGSTNQNPGEDFTDLAYTEVAAVDNANITINKVNAGSL